MIILASLLQSSLDTILALANGGSIAVYSGSRPSNLVVGAGVLLVSCPLGNPCAFATDVNGNAVLKPITTSAPIANGLAAFAFIRKSDGTPILNLSVGLAGAGKDLVLDNLTISIGGTVSLGGSVTHPQGS